MKHSSPICASQFGRAQSDPAACPSSSSIRLAFDLWLVFGAPLVIAP
jgi:hypothetical protein